MKVPRILLFLLLAVLTLLGGCAFPAAGGAPEKTSLPPTPTLPPAATVTIRARFPQAKGTFTLAVLDEVTGLNIAPQRYRMRSVGNGVYQAVIHVPKGTVLKYRYERRSPDGAVHLEGLTNGTISRYRLAAVSGDMTIDDWVARWDDTAYNGATGWIFGRVTDAKGNPIPDVMITAAGMRTFSLADGSYRLEGVPAGVHNLVAYHPDGRYAVFQHLAEVGDGTATKADIVLAPRPLVQVRFVVDLPDETPQGAPVRLAGNLLSLGNTFSDLAGGLNTLAALMPRLQPVALHEYAITLKLPAGADLRYKYTLGDGFWNAERDAKGGFVLRRLIVPDHDAEFHDVVASWRAGAQAPAWFEVTVPPSTPAGERVFIQFNPAVWTPPLPMWYMGGHKWGYPLYGPTDIAAKMPYRYCRGGQCDAPSRNVHTYLAKGARELSDSAEWRWWAGLGKGKPVGFGALPKRKSGFWAGVAFMPAFSPSWDARREQAMAELRSMHANTVVLTPSWTATRSNPPFWEPQPPADQLSTDVLAWSQAAHRNGLFTVLYPVVRFPGGAAKWWDSSPADFPWWQSWFDRYRAMAVHFAALAQQSGASALVLGGEWVEPALLGASLPDGRASGVPADADLRWLEILKAVRKVYSGAVYWAMPQEEAVLPPPFVAKFDGVYLLWKPNLGAKQSEWGKATEAELEKYAAAAAHKTGKPVVLAVYYPSAKGARGGCLPAEKGCVPDAALYPASPTAQDVAVDLATQQKAYFVLLKAAAKAKYLGGVVSADFYPPIPLQDPSASVHGKPAQEMLARWFKAVLP